MANGKTSGTDIASATPAAAAIATGSAAESPAAAPRYSVKRVKTEPKDQEYGVSSIHSAYAALQAGDEVTDTKNNKPLADVMKDRDAAKNPKSKASKKA